MDEKAQCNARKTKVNHAADYNIEQQVHDYFEKNKICSKLRKGNVYKQDGKKIDQRTWNETKQKMFLV